MLMLNLYLYVTEHTPQPSVRNSVSLNHVHVVERAIITRMREQCVLGSFSPSTLEPGYEATGFYSTAPLVWKNVLKSHMLGIPIIRQASAHPL